MSRYDDILARLRAATGPDRSIDRKIGLSICGWRQMEGLYGFDIYPMIVTDEGEFSDRPGGGYPSLTEDFAATLEFCCSAFPDADFGLKILARGGAYAWMNNPRRSAHEYGATIAIALWIVVIEALKAKEE